MRYSPYFIFSLSLNTTFFFVNQKERLQVGQYNPTGTLNLSLTQQPRQPSWNLLLRIKKTKQTKASNTKWLSLRIRFIRRHPEKGMNTNPTGEQHKSLTVSCPT